MHPGRNDPCPCGSGRKYKKCCGLNEDHVASRDVLRVDAIKRAQHDLDERMLRYARLRFGADWLFDALDAYTAGTRVEMSKMEEQFAVPWAMYHWDNAPHRLSLARTFLDSDGDRLPSDQQDVLTSCLNAWLGIWEVTQIEKGRGFVAVDQLSKQERFIHEKRGTETLRMRDSILDMSSIAMESPSCPAFIHTHSVLAMPNRSFGKCAGCAVYERDRHPSRF
jgi:hypothetical protein